MAIELGKIRVDKWIWAVRLYKSRSLAGKNCNSGKVKVNGENAKASHPVKIGDRVTLRKGPVKFDYEVKGIIEKRVSAQLAAEYYVDHSPPPPPRPGKSKLDSAFYDFPAAQRDRGAGRPTKRDRREIDRLQAWGIDDEEE